MKSTIIATIFALSALTGCAAIVPDRYASFTPKPTDTPEDIARGHAAIDLQNEAFSNDTPGNVTGHIRTCKNMRAAWREYVINSVIHKEGPQADTQKDREDIGQIYDSSGFWHDVYTKCVFGT